MAAAEFEPLQELPVVAGTVDRRQYVVDRAAGRRVLHLGCVDDRLTETRLREGLLLHERLSRVAEDLVGVDISEEGIAILRREVPGEYLVGDVEHLEALTLPEDVDLVVASELIEHLLNPGLFLTGLRDLLAKTGAAGIITTPNAYGWISFSKMAVRRREPTHPDHVLLYSPYTLVGALGRAGLHVDDLLVHDWSRGGGPSDRLRSVVAGAVRRWNPYLGVGLVANVSVR